MTQGWLLFRNTRSWYKALFKDGFSHVSVIIETDEHQKYLHIDPAGSGMRYEFMGDCELDSIMDMNHCEVDGSIFRVIPIELNGEDGTQHKPSVFTCVELVKRTIGLRKWWILTPYQLYKHTRRASWTLLKR